MDAGYRGSFVWHELMTTDPGGASAFYPKLIKWKTQAWDGDPSYTLFMAGGMPVAGLMKMTEEARAMGGSSGWLAYIGTPDVDATVTAALRLGAKVMKAALDLPKVGRIAILMDPQGACFGIYKPSVEMPPPPAPVPGDFCWHELITSDPEAAFKFYATLFGWAETRRMDMGAMGTYYIFGKSGKDLGGMFKKPPGHAGPPTWLSYSDVADVKRAAAAINSGGGKILMEPMQVPGGGWIVQAMDAQGAVFAVHQAPPAVKPATAAAKPAAAKPKETVKAAVKPKAKAKSKPKAKTKAKPKAAAKAKKPTTKRKTGKKKVAAKRKPAAKTKQAKTKKRAKAKSRPARKAPAKKKAARKK